MSFGKVHGDLVTIEKSQSVSVFDMLSLIGDAMDDAVSHNGTGGRFADLPLGDQNKVLQLSFGILRQINLLFKREELDLNASALPSSIKSKLEQAIKSAEEEEQLLAKIQPDLKRIESSQSTAEKLQGEVAMIREKIEHATKESEKWEEKRKAEERALDQELKKKKDAIARYEEWKNSLPEEMLVLKQRFEELDDEFKAYITVWNSHRQSADLSTTLFSTDKEASFSQCKGIESFPDLTNWFSGLANTIEKHLKDFSSMLCSVGEFLNSDSVK